MQADDINPARKSTLLDEESGAFVSRSPATSMPIVFRSFDDAAPMRKRKKGDCHVVKHGPSSQSTLTAKRSIVSESTIHDTSAFEEIEDSLQHELQHWSTISLVVVGFLIGMLKTVKSRFG